MKESDFTLNETDVIEAVCDYLVSFGYDILQKLKPTQRGDDIVAVKKSDPSLKIFIEAKGATSSKTGTNRFGKPFNTSQIRSHIGRALLKASEIMTREEGRNVRVGIALPETQKHQMIVNKSAKGVALLDVAVFWVDEEHKVRFASSWEL